MLKNKAQVISQNHIETFGFNKTISRIELVGLFEVLLAVFRILKGPRGLVHLSIGSNLNN